MPKSVFQYPSPRELAEYLRQPGIEKAKGQFRIADGRCCLGHAADMLGLKYPYDQDVFHSELDSMLSQKDVPLSPGHWLVEHSASLADINDASDGFDEVIAYLEALEPAGDPEQADG